MSTYAEDMTVVQASTEQIPGLAEEIARRHEQGLDTYDEWWNGVYRIVTGPSPEHGALLDDLAELLGPLVRAAGLKSSAPANIGIDRQNCRVPDRAIYEPNTPRTSPAFLTSALLVIEVLSPGERSKEKLDFYQAHGVTEYLEINLQEGLVELWGWSESLAGLDARWVKTSHSEILPGLQLEEDCLIHTPARSIAVADYKPRG